MLGNLVLGAGREASHHVFASQAGGRRGTSVGQSGYRGLGVRPRACQLHVDLRGFAYPFLRPQARRETGKRVSVLGKALKIGAIGGLCFVRSAASEQ